MQINLKSGKLFIEVENTDFELEEICGFASRQNPKRGFLFVSKILGKHYPVKPKKMKKIYELIGGRLCNNIDAKSAPLFLGFAETATGFSSGVYNAWKACTTQYSYFIHTTRYNFSGNKVLFNFQEEHSHATGHIVYHPEDNNFSLGNHDTLILLDDEMTTGKTMMNFIDEFIKLKDCKVKKIVMVCIKNWMTEDSMLSLRKRFVDLEIDFVHLLKGSYSFEKDSCFVCEDMPNLDGNNSPKNSIISKNYGRFGFEKFNNYNFDELVKDFDMSKRTLVLGTGEFSYYPFLLAEYLECKGVDVFYQSTTRSPIMIGNDIMHKISFKDNYEDKIPNFIYNVCEDEYEQVIICYETKNVGDLDLDKKLKAKNVFFENLKAIK